MRRPPRGAQGILAELARLKTPLPPMGQETRRRAVRASTAADHFPRPSGPEDLRQRITFPREYCFPFAPDERRSGCPLLGVPNFLTRGDQ